MYKKFYTTQNCTVTSLNRYFGLFPIKFNQCFKFNYPAKLPQNGTLLEKICTVNLLPPKSALWINKIDI